MKKNILLISCLLLGSCSIVASPSTSDSSSNENNLSSGLESSTGSEMESTLSSEYSSEISNSSEEASESSSETASDIELTDITLSTNHLEFKSGETYQIQVGFVPNDATNKKLSFSSSNAEVASVTSGGRITANDEGSATISVTANNSITKNIDVAVTRVPLPELSSKSFTSSTAPYYGNEYFYTNNLNPQVTSIANGVQLTQYTYSPVDGGASKNVYTVTIDLNLASIEVGTASNSYFPSSNAILGNQAKSYESATGRKVLAAVNGDYFGFYSSYNSNGFCVKDGVVISSKSASYENLVNGMMSLSISYNDVATIAACAPNASTFYRVDNYIELYNDATKKVGNYMISAINNHDVLDMYLSERSRDYEVVTKGGQAVTNRNVIYVNKTNTYGNSNEINFPLDGSIQSIHKDYTGTISLDSNQIALLVSNSFLLKAKTNYRVRVGVTQSDNEAFTGVKTVITGRHNLIKNYQILSTLANESTNDAKKNRARTSVGILGDGKVMLFVCEDSTKGLNLVQVADFMRYQGCKYAFNLDGGGSTGLMVRKNNALTLQAGLNTRRLANTLLVVEK